MSLPHGSADRNDLDEALAAGLYGRSLTGARIETVAVTRAVSRVAVAPSRERGSKHAAVHRAGRVGRRSLTGARIETGAR